MANALGYVTETKAGFEGSLAMMNLSAANTSRSPSQTRRSGLARSTRTSRL
jgi:hypothetical protein